MDSGKVGAKTGAIATPTPLPTSEKPTQNSQINTTFAGYIVREIVPNVAPFWEDLGIGLKVENLNGIARDSADNKARCQAMFTQICDKGDKTFTDLIEALEKIQKNRFACILRETLPKGEPVHLTPTVKKQPTTLPGYDVNLNESHLATLANLNRKLSSNWESIAYCLGISHSRVESIHRDSRGTEEAMQKVWENWLSEGKDRTTQHLLRALVTVGQVRWAFTLNRQCEKPYPEEIKPFTYTLPKSTELEEKHKNALFNLIPEAVISKWDSFGLELGFTYDAIDAIKADCQGSQGSRGNSRRSCIALLSQWIDKGGATVEKFLKALNGCQLIAAAGKFKHHLVEP